MNIPSGLIIERDEIRGGYIVYAPNCFGKLERVETVGQFATITDEELYDETNRFDRETYNRYIEHVLEGCAR